MTPLPCFSGVFKNGALFLGSCEFNFIFIFYFYLFIFIFSAQLGPKHSNKNFTHTKKFLKHVKYVCIWFILSSVAYLVREVLGIYYRNTQKNCINTLQRPAVPK
jgi:hypothetical protein